MNNLLLYHNYFRNIQILKASCVLVLVCIFLIICLFRKTGVKYTTRAKDYLPFHFSGIKPKISDIRSVFRELVSILTEVDFHTCNTKYYIISGIISFKNIT